MKNREITIFEKIREKTPISPQTKTLKKNIIFQAKTYLYRQWVEYRVLTW